VTDVFDLDEYLERIGYEGSRRPTLDTLAALQLHHTRTIPFENLNPLLGWPVRLDPGSLHQKLVRDGRGGYCYEQNLLFAHALTALGFRWRGLAARVRWNVPGDAPRPRSHILLEVDAGGTEYLADVGFGGVTLTAPLRFIADIVQPTPHEPFRLVREDAGFVAQVRIGEDWRALYAFGTESYLLPDYEMANWFVSTHPASIFVNSLMVARAAADCRYTLLNQLLAVHRIGGGTERRTLTGASGIRSALADTFGIRLPDTPDLEKALTRVVDAAAHPPHP
jgi:N-hydroxyarylamine O-acetyltransferase